MSNIDNTVTEILAALQAEIARLESELANCNRPRRAEFFQNSEYRGESIVFSPGQSHERLSQHPQGDWNDRISSIQIDEGAIVRVWRDMHFHGESREYRFSQPHLGDWNDKISSLRVEESEKLHHRRSQLEQTLRQKHEELEKLSTIQAEIARLESELANCNRPRRAEFFQNSEYRGESIVFSPGQSHERLSQHPQGDWNDRISSIQIDEGVIVRVWEDKYFHGESREYRFSQPHLGDWNDKISSLRVEESEKLHHRRSQLEQTLRQKHEELEKLSTIQ